MIHGTTKPIPHWQDARAIIACSKIQSNQVGNNLMKMSNNKEDFS